MNQCLICNGLISMTFNFTNLFKYNNNYICQKCLNKLDRVTTGCIYCGKKTNDNICSDCLFWISYEKTKMFKIINYSMYYYNDFAKIIIERLKFLGDCKILYAFSKEIKAFFKINFYTKNYYLVPVPLHNDRLIERGFNQSLYISKLLSYKILDILSKTNNDKQSKKKRSERIIFDNNYILKSSNNLENKKIIIIDDIYTTGSTVHKIGKLLYDNGAKEIVSFTLFRS